MSDQLVVHRGGWTASPADLAAVAVPDETESYVPVPYGRLIEEVKLHVPRFGLRVVREDYALAREGAQMFGVLTCENGTVNRTYALAIGLRSSYDRSLAVELVAGSRVFCCDNLAFHGEAGARVRRKHTVNVFRDLPDLIYRMLNEVSVMKDRMAEEITTMQSRILSNYQAEHIMVETIRRGVLPASRLPKLLEVYEKPMHQDFIPNSAWALFNAYTELEKSRSPASQMDGTLRLTACFRDCLSLN
jgi:hypothetical protein